MENAALPIQLGDVGTWVGGLATAAALIFTYVLLRITRQEQRDTQTAQREAQARLVSVWSDYVGPASGNGLHTITVKLQNLSDEPIYGVRAAVGVRWSVDRVPCEELDILYIMPPKSTRQQDVSLRLERAPDGTYEPAPPVEVAFYDATRGGLWFRDRFGRLAQLKGEKSASISEQFLGKADQS